MMQQIVFFPAPLVAAPVMSCSALTTEAAWADVREQIAEYVGCSEDALHTEQFAWNNGERFAEFVVEAGSRIVGSLDDRLEIADWRDLFDVRVADAA